MPNTFSSQRGAGPLVSVLAGAIGALLILILVSRSPATLSRLFGTPPPTSVTPTITSATSSPAANVLTSFDGAVVDTVKRAQPAVVSIIITKDVPVVERFFESVPGPSSPFDNFFGFPQFEFRVPQLRQRGTQKQEIGGGSGFLVSADGMIVTNRHVVSDEEADYTVFTNDGKKHEARVVARDPANDIAIIKIEGSNFSFLEFGNSDQLQVGQTAIAIGNALSEFRNTVSVGVVSGLARSIVAGDNFGQAEQLEQVIQTDAAINPGNSGGPLLNLAGQVIGVNVAVAQGSENIGFALPANTVNTVVDSVKQTGKIVRPFLGVRYVQITPVLKERNRLSVDYGVLVSRGETAEDLAVVPGSPADKAGIREGDIILEVDGTRLTEDTSLAAIIRTKKVGDTVRLKLLSQGSEREVTATLTEVPQ